MSGDDMTLEEIEARLGELNEKEEQADDLNESFNDAIAALADIHRHPLVDSEPSSQVKLLKDMLRQIRQHDIRLREGIHHNRHALRDRAAELRYEKEAEA